MSTVKTERKQEAEEVGLSSFASPSSKSQRLNPQPPDYRLAYRRDADAILHSNAFARYADKTQVIYLLANDHISHRNLHVQLVNSLAQGIATNLKLNRDLTEAIALGHDVGHPPFGHEGETYLSELSVENGHSFFAHPLQSCRLFTDIEPVNLSLAVLDGILCHDGGMQECVYQPKREKDWTIHQEEVELKRQDPTINLMPMTLEGCLVKICDTVSYLARDLEDAISVKILTRDQIPENFLGDRSERILKNFAEDLLKMSQGKDAIAISEEAFEAIRTLRRFNFDSIYTHPMIKSQSEQIKRSYHWLFSWLLEDHQKSEIESYVWKYYLKDKPQKYLEETSNIQKVIDYIAGMTDGYYLETLKRLMVPKEIQL